MKLLSLRWQLIWSLILLQVVVGLLVMGGFIGLAWVLGRVVDETGEETVRVIRDAVVRADDGVLALAPTPEFEQLRGNAGAGLWFIVRDAQGHQLVQGEVPERYLGLAGRFDGIDRVWIDLATSNGQPKARFERVETRAGPVAMMVQTGSPCR